MSDPLVLKTKEKKAHFQSFGPFLFLKFSFHSREFAVNSILFHYHRHHHHHRSTVREHIPLSHLGQVSVNDNSLAVITLRESLPLLVREFSVVIFIWWPAAAVAA